MNWRLRKPQAPHEPERQAEPAELEQPQPLAERVFETKFVTPTEIIEFFGQRRAAETRAEPEGPKTLAQSQAEQRAREARDACHSEQPFEWATHVALTVDGRLRWRCCGNLFTDDHTPYCFMPPGIQL